MKTAVATARSGDYAASLQSLDKIISGEGADKLAANLVAEWTRLKPENRDKTNILVLDNATRLIVNTQIREVLKREGAIAAEDARIDILAPSGMTDQEKHFARFYSGGQVVMFARDNAGLGRSEEHTSELQSLMRISYAVFCLKKQIKKPQRQDEKRVRQIQRHEQEQP